MYKFIVRRVADFKSNDLQIAGNNLKVRCRWWGVAFAPWRRGMT